MKIIFTLITLLAIRVYSQTYLGVAYNNGATLNSTNLSLLHKITFSGTDINFLLTDNTTVNKTISTVDKMTFSGVNGNNPLPVELVSFTASEVSGEVYLKWTTATELRNYGFDIEKSVYGTAQWEKSGFVKGSGNSNSAKEYSFKETPKGSSKLNYRLKQIDTDGKYNYSNVLEVSLNIPIQFELKQNYPNPFNPCTKIGYNIPNAGMVTIKVCDILGTEIATIVDENKKAGSYEVIFDGSKLTSGVYLCKLVSANYTSSIKMLILK